MAPPPDDALIRRLDEATQDAVPVVVGVLAILYVVVGLTTAAFAQMAVPQGKPIMVAVTFSCAAGLGLGWWSLRARTRPIRWANGLIAGVAVLVVSTSITRLYFTHAALMAVFAIGVILMGSAMILRRRWLLLVCGVSVVQWVVVASTIQWSIAWTRATAGLIGMTIVAYFLQRIRVRRFAEDLESQRKLEAMLERTREAQDAESRARKAAEVASREKSQFLAHISHEIRTPLNAVLGMARLLLDSTLEPEQEKYAQMVRDAGEGMLALVNDLLDLSKIESGRLVLETIDLDVAEIARGSVTLLQEQARQRGVTLRTTIDDELPRRLRGDPGRLRQIMLNLLSNGIKFTEHGEVGLRIDTVRADEQSVDLRFEVSDTGPGIPPDQLDTLFEPYVQADSSTRRRFGGTGLGLAIVRHLVEQMDGEISVDSEIGVGSTFRFTLNVVRGAAAAEDELEREPEVVVSAPVEGMEILVAEDNATNQMLIKVVLTRLGYQPTLVANGAAAVEAVEEHDYAAVLMDVQMPVLDGVEATQAIREAEADRGRRVPIIACTANAFAEERERCLAAGMDGYLTKPLEIEALSRELARRALITE